MSRVLLGSDYHWSHRGILKYRTMFGSSEEHDHTILENTLMVVGKRDTLYLLGDMLFDTNAVKFLKAVADNCSQVIWILGNHDCPKAVMLATQQISNLQVFGLKSYKKTWLSHAPIHESEFYSKIKNIHGHTHNKCIKDTRYFNASLDNINFKPVLFTEIIGGYMGELYS